MSLNDVLVLPSSLCWPCERRASAVARWGRPLGGETARKKVLADLNGVWVTLETSGCSHSLSGSPEESEAASLVKKEKDVRRVLLTVTESDRWEGSAHLSSVRTSVCTSDLIPLRLTWVTNSKLATTVQQLSVLGADLEKRRRLQRLTSKTTTSTFTFGGSSTSGWKDLTMATSRCTVASRSLLCMTDRLKKKKKQKEKKKSLDWCDRALCQYGVQISRKHRGWTENW